MRNLRIATVGVLFAASLAGAMAAPAAAAPAPERQTYLVTFQPGTSADARASELRGQGWTVRQVYRNLLSGVAVELPAPAAAALARRADVQRVEADGVATATDTRPVSSWGLDRTDQRGLPLNGSFSYPATAGLGTKAFIVDTGVRATHVDFGGRVVSGYTPSTMVAEPTTATATEPTSPAPSPAAPGALPLERRSCRSGSWTARVRATTAGSSPGSIGSPPTEGPPRRWST